MAIPFHLLEPGEDPTRLPSAYKKKIDVPWLLIIAGAAFGLFILLYVLPRRSAHPAQAAPPIPMNQETATATGAPIEPTLTPIFVPQWYEVHDSWLIHGEWLRWGYGYEPPSTPPTATPTETGTPTNTPTRPPTKNEAMATIVATATKQAKPIKAQPETSTPTATPTDTPAPPTEPPTYTPYPTYTRYPTYTPYPTPTHTPTPLPTDTPTEGPTDTPIPTQAENPAEQPPTQPDIPNLPSGVGEHDRWVDVNLSLQTTYAYEGTHVIRSFLVSTGTWLHPTVTGEFNIYVKYVYGDMAGPGYYLPDVPYVMYFYKGYGLHGTYWHHNFGTPMSHGCINLTRADAAWLYSWAPVGTLVAIHW
jgi:lipoprotein-anchoring transpeptidase ErfK/SrfK